jgi:hypothetical protein
MATIQEQYAELIRQGQDAALAAYQTWNRTLQQAFGQRPAGWFSPEQAIDRYFDFAGQVLNAQRDLAKQIVATSSAAAEKVRTGMAEATEQAAGQA